MIAGCRSWSFHIHVRGRSCRQLLCSSRAHHRHINKALQDATATLQTLPPTCRRVHLLPGEQADNKAVEMLPRQAHLSRPSTSHLRARPQ